MTRDEVAVKVDILSRYLTYPELDDLHALNDNDAEQRAAYKERTKEWESAEATIEEQREEITRLREIVERFFDVQNGPPLEKYKEAWIAVMKDARKVLGYTSTQEPT